MNRIITLIVLISLLLIAGCEKTKPASCPEITIPDKFFPLQDDELITLDASKISISDDYTIALPEKQPNPFTDFGETICKQGSKAGENINHMYCGQLMIQKLVTNKDGEIIKTMLLGVKFVFDKDNQLVETTCFS